MSAVFPVVEDDRFRTHTATAGQVLFALPFVFQQNSDIAIEKIALDGTVSNLTEPADYSLSGAGDPAGGSYTLTVPALAGEKYRSIGDAVMARSSSIVSAGKFASKATDDDLDRALIRDLELKRDIKRALKVAYGADAPLLDLDGAVEGETIVVKADGALGRGANQSTITAAQGHAEQTAADRVQTGLDRDAAGVSAAAALAAAAGVDLPPVTPSTMLVDNAAGTAREARTRQQVLDDFLKLQAGDVKFTQLDVGAVERSVWQVINEAPINVRNYGADPLDPDNAPFFAKARAALGGSGGLYVPRGRYRFATGGAIDTQSTFNIRMFGDNSQAFFSSGLGTLLVAGPGHSLINCQGIQGLEISNIELTYEDPAYANILIDLRKRAGTFDTSAVDIHHARIGGRLGANGAILIWLADTYGVKLSDSWLDGGVHGVLGADIGEFANQIALERVKFGNNWNGGVPIRMGGHAWSVEKCTFEPNLAGLAAAVQTTAQGVQGLHYTGNLHDDGITTGIWFSVNGPILGALIAGNWFRNAERAMALGASKGVNLLGNTIYARESQPPIDPGTADILEYGTTLLTDSGLNIPALFTALPAAGFVDNYDGAGRKLLGSLALTSRLRLAASTAALGSMNLPVGVAPAAPADGEVWRTAGGVFLRDGAVTKTFTLT